MTKSIRQQRTLREHLHEDLTRHGDPEEHKRTGDLLLANIATAVRDGNKVRLNDYYAEGAPTIEIEVDENRSLQDEAARVFAVHKSKTRGRRDSGATEADRSRNEKLDRRLSNSIR